MEVTVTKVKTDPKTRHRTVPGPTILFLIAYRAYPEHVQEKMTQGPRPLQVHDTHSSRSWQLLHTLSLRRLAASPENEGFLDCSKTAKSYP